MSNIKKMLTGKSTLIQLMELAKENTNDRKAIVELLPKEMEDKYRGEIVKKELLLSEAVSRTGLVQTFLSDKVVEGAH